MKVFKLYFFDEEHSLKKIIFEAIFHFLNT